ncbi:WLM-domain-containing protein [Auriscalpium vulgare]|uniref:WLM-domain-containing protein n=1 Tax=Auriscalpium vulgare TaxID=40419 RepID=A0ACB8RXY9_9AGAM|nr:WLM-domain-containing protein [Auriscalpium vulgare]
MSLDSPASSNAPAKAPSPITVHVSHRGTTHTLSLLPTDTLALLASQLALLTDVPRTNQKYLFKGKKVSPGAEEDDASPGEGSEGPGDGQRTLEDLGVREGVKLTLLGATRTEVGGMHAAEDEQRRVERILRERAQRGTVKVRSTASAAPTPFLRIALHSTLPHSTPAHALLTRLSTDPAVQSVMAAHQFTVGMLTELAPHENPDLLGLNVNKGEVVKLRVRTDAYDGTRAYGEVRRVLCHELAHNVWGDHDDNFKTLDSQLTKEVAAFERAAREGAHTLDPRAADAYVPPEGSYSDFVYAPPVEREKEARAQILGGTKQEGDSAEDRRRLAREAAERRAAR